MKTLGVLGFAFALLLSAVDIEARFVQSIALIPPAPSEADSIAVRIAGWLPNSCWSMEYEARGETMHIFLYPLPVDLCAQVVLPFTIEWELGLLPPGEHRLRIVEHDPQGLEQFGLTFSVDGTVNTRKTTWGDLRLRFRD